MTQEPVVFPARDYGESDPEWMKIDWRPHLHRVELPGATVNYAEIGEGEPIIFVHGLAGCWRNWLPNLPHFGRTHRAIALDLPGFGDSPMPTWEIEMSAYGRLLHDFCEKLGIERATLVGNSMGGFASTEAAIETPSRFDRLVLISAAGISFAEAHGRPLEAGLRTFEATVPLLAKRARRIWLTRRRGRVLAFGNILRYPNLLRGELLAEQMEPSVGSAGFPAAIRAISGYDTRHRLAEIEIPTMVVWGLSDRIVPVEAAIGYHRLIRGSRLEIFERTGHMPHLERPARFNALLDEFLTD